MVTGLKNSLQEQAVPGRQHCMGCNPPKKANCRAEQSLWGWEDAGLVKCSGTGSSQNLSNDLGVCYRLS